MSTESTPAVPATAQDAVKALQAQALDTIKTGQQATLDAIKKWNEGFAQYSTNLPATPEVPAEVKQAFGEPNEIVDSVYDFAAQLLELNKKFVHDLLQVSATDK